MNILSTILKELKTPDDQGTNWYAWASNQLSHALIGALFCGIPIMIFGSLVIAFCTALGIAVVKEIFDIWRKPKGFKDSMNDIGFQLAGIEFAIGLYINSYALFFYSIFFGAVLLWIGVSQRIKVE